MSNHLAFISNEKHLTMKVNLPKDNGFQKKTPILTLIDDESTHRLTKANAVSFDLKVDPDPQLQARRSVWDRYEYCIVRRDHHVVDRHPVCPDALG